MSLDSFDGHGVAGLQSLQRLQYETAKNQFLEF